MAQRDIAEMAKEILHREVYKCVEKVLIEQRDSKTVAIAGNITLVLGDYEAIYDAARKAEQLGHAGNEHYLWMGGVAKSDICWYLTAKNE